MIQTRKCAQFNRAIFLPFFFHHVLYCQETCDEFIETDCICFLFSFVTDCKPLQQKERKKRDRTVMAVSLALNWSPPPSSPLFDESTPPGGVSLNTETSQGTNLTSLPLTDSTNNMSNLISNNGSGLSINSLSKQLQSSSQNGSSSLQTPGRSSSTSPQPRTYAAAASNPQKASQYPMPSFPGPAVTSSVSKEKHKVRKRELLIAHHLFFSNLDIIRGCVKSKPLQ